jgi:hypothetical protein
VEKPALRGASRLLVGEGVLFGATLAWSEPLTALPRSARSRVSSSRSLWKAPTRTPSPSSRDRQLRARLVSDARARGLRRGPGYDPCGPATPSGRRAERHRHNCARRSSQRVGFPSKHSRGMPVVLPSPICWEGGRGCPRRRRSASDQETRDRAERGSAVRGSARASVVDEEDTRARLTGDDPRNAPNTSGAKSSERLRRNPRARS